MGVTLITKKSLVDFKNKSPKPPNCKTKGVVQTCPNQTDKKKVIKFESACFTDKQGKVLEGIDKEGDVDVLLKGTNLAGRKIFLDLSDHVDIKFYYKEAEITAEQGLLIDMTGDSDSIVLQTAFKIK